MVNDNKKKDLKSVPFIYRFISRLFAHSEEKQVAETPKKNKTAQNNKRKRTKKVNTSSLLKKLKKRFQELEKQERLISLHEEKLEFIEKEIELHQRKGKKNIRHLLRDRDLLSKKSEVLKSKERQLNKRFGELRSQLSELRKQEKNIEKKEKIIKDLVEKSVPPGDIIDELKSIGSHTALDIKKEQLDDRERKLDEREEILIRQELDLGRQEKLLKDAERNFLLERNKFEDLMSIKSKDLESFEKNWKAKESALKKLRVAISRKKAEVTRLIKEEVSKLNHAKRQFKDRYESLSEKQQVIEEKLKHLIVEKKYYNKWKKIAIAKERELKKREVLLEEKNSKIAADTLRLKTKADTIIKSGSKKIEQDKVMIPLVNKRKTKIKKSRSKIKAVKTDNIPGMLKQARLLLNSGDVSAAHDIISALEGAYQRMHTSHTKEELRYDLMDLKTSLKLATLM